MNVIPPSPTNISLETAPELPHPSPTFLVIVLPDTATPTVSTQMTSEKLLTLGVIVTIFDTELFINRELIISKLYDIRS